MEALTPRPRSVRFASSAPIVTPIPTWYIRLQEDRELRQEWWSSSESDAIKESACSVADSITMDNDCIPTPASRRSYFRTMRKVVQFSMQDCDDELPESWKRDLVFWVSVGHARRGLERYILERLDRFSRKRKQIVREAVFYVQETCLNRSIPHEQECDLIRAASESVSKTGKKYAFLMGTADEAAARMEHREVPRREVSNKDFLGGATIIKEERLEEGGQENSPRSLLPRAGQTPRSLSPCTRTWAKGAPYRSTVVPQD